MILGQANTEVLKEPRGFIKFIQIIVAICAFACAVSNHSQTGFKFECNANTTTTKPGNRVLPYYYPYNLEVSTDFLVPLCPEMSASTKTAKASCYGDYSNPAQFFVFVGVTAFLISLATLLFYILADDKYHQIDFLPSLDFVVTIFYTILWFVSSSVWADGVVKIRHYTDPESLFTDTPRNQQMLPGCIKQNCTVDASQPAAYANLNFSVIFGYLCFFVWAGNVWFLYKETAWYKNKQTNSAGAGGTDQYPPSNLDAI